MEVRSDICADSDRLGFGIGLGSAAYTQNNQNCSDLNKIEVLFFFSL